MLSKINAKMEKNHNHSYWVGKKSLETLKIHKKGKITRIKNGLQG